MLSLPQPLLRSDDRPPSGELFWNQHPVRWPAGLLRNHSRLRRGRFEGIRYSSTVRLRVCSPLKSLARDREALDPRAIGGWVLMLSNPISMRPALAAIDRCSGAAHRSPPDQSIGYLQRGTPRPVAANRDCCEQSATARVRTQHQPVCGEFSVTQPQAGDTTSGSEIAIGNRQGRSRCDRSSRSE